MTTLHKVRFQIVFYYDKIYGKFYLSHQNTMLKGHTGGDPLGFYLSCQLKAPLHVFIRMMIIKLIINGAFKNRKFVVHAFQYILDDFDFLFLHVHTSGLNIITNTVGFYRDELKKPFHDTVGVNNTTKHYHKCICNCIYIVYVI